ncbi:hypothetical protein RCNV-85A-007 [Raccoonpox virus]|uniref:Protein OPG030 n=1 Tax=Raccoon poxvirus TaxID=10256 RepID=A0A0G3FXI9_RACVI|nr:Kelch-like protein [Raccoonpox virus]AKJ93653.1 Kelch-like protein [Raccoonpox virus]AOP31284.1 hypothetical protein RCNV-85A-007 [Raccoonpox virus]
MNKLDFDKLKNENIFSTNTIEDAKEFYFGTRKIYTDSVEDLIELFALANYLNEQDLKDVVIDRMNYVSTYIGKDDWATIYSFYKENRLTNDFVRQYINSNIETIYNTESFLKLDADAVFDILNDDELVITSEYNVLNIIIRWLENKRVDIDDFTKIMFAVRFNFITYREIINAAEKIAPEYRRHLLDVYYIRSSRPKRSII